MLDAAATTPARSPARDRIADPMRLVQRVSNTETLFLPPGSQHGRSPLAGDHATLAAAKVARKRAPTPRPLRAATIGPGISAVLHWPGTTASPQSHPHNPDAIGARPAPTRLRR
jgi:hypothetical protein